MSFQEDTTESSESLVEPTAGVGGTEPTSETDTLLENPEDQRVEDYITGKFG